jgi:nickel transport protein
MSSWTRVGTLFVVALLGGGPTAFAHEILHEVERGRAVAVHAWSQDGDSLAHVQAEVFSPSNASVPHWKGLTDRNGWVAFVPDVPGTWRVRIVDSTGHGLDTRVEVAAPGVNGGAAEAAPSGGTTLALVLRPVVGVALIAAIFGFLYLRARRRRP